MIIDIRQRLRRLHEYLREPLYLDFGGLAERRWARQTAGALAVVAVVWAVSQAERLPGGNFVHGVVRTGMKADVDLVTAWRDLREAQVWEDPTVSGVIARLRGPLADLAARRRGEPPRDATLVRGGTTPESAAPANAQVDRGAAGGSGSTVTRVGELARAPSPAPFPHWPVDRAIARVATRFGWQDHPVTRERVFYEGVDIEAPAGAVVLAVDAGTVAGTGEDPTFGRWIEIDHGNGLTTFYAHLESVVSRKSEPVRAGQRIGAVGRTGLAPAPKLHFQVRAGGKPIEPEPFLSIAPR